MNTIYKGKWTLIPFYPPFVLSSSVFREFKYYVKVTGMTKSIDIDVMLNDVFNYHVYY